MPSSLLKKLLCGVAFLLSIQVLAGQYPDEAKSTQTTVTVHVVWLPSFDAVNHFCSFLMCEPIPKDGTIVGCYNPMNQTIYAVEPTSFNDHFRLEVLGHEFWHALGATHP